MEEGVKQTLGHTVIPGLKRPEALLAEAASCRAQSPKFAPKERKKGGGALPSVPVFVTVHRTELVT